MRKLTNALGLAALLCASNLDNVSYARTIGIDPYVAAEQSTSEQSINPRRIGTIDGSSRSLVNAAAFAGGASAILGIAYLIKEVIKPTCRH